MNSATNKELAQGAEAPRTGLDSQQTMRATQDQPSKGTEDKHLVAPRVSDPTKDQVETKLGTPRRQEADPGQRQPRRNRVCANAVTFNLNV